MGTAGAIEAVEGQHQTIADLHQQVVGKSLRQIYGSFVLPAPQVKVHGLHPHTVIITRIQAEQPGKQALRFIFVLQTVGSYLK